MKILDMKNQFKLNLPFFREKSVHETFRDYERERERERERMRERERERWRKHDS